MNGYEGVARSPPACVHKFFPIENYIYINFLQFLHLIQRIKISCLDGSFEIPI